MFTFKNFHFPEQDKLIFFLIFFFPIALILGNFFVNIFYVFFAISAIYHYKNLYNFFYSKIFYLLLLFLICLIINLIFSINITNSFPRLIKFILIILFVSEIQRVIFKNDYLIDKVIFIWNIIFFIVTADIIFELLFGFNTLGFRSPMPGRISSFFGDELVVGSFYHFFSLFILAYLIKKKTSDSKILIISLIFIFVSFFIGERANFVRLFISILIFLFIINNSSFLKKISVTILILLSLSIMPLLNNDLKHRYYYQVKSLYSKNGFITYFKESQYGAHQATAFEIFRKNILVGIGVKNFRIESKKDIYRNDEYKKTMYRQATHPHQIHVELLSETGLLGYLSFLTLIIYSLYFSILNYLKNKNLFQLSTIIFLITSLIPVLPTGSIFSTFYGGIFWFNFGLMFSFNKLTKV
tara:strand:- start:1306 stop:2541 length:1236 start_codon:yes stop_codon:yes gene_type:complete